MRIPHTLDQYLFAPADEKPLALFRIVAGILMVLIHLALLPQWSTFYGKDGFIDPNPGHLAPLLQLPGVPGGVYAGIGLLASLGFLLGYRTWTMTLVLFLLQSARNHINPLSVNGEDLVLRYLLFFSLFLRLDGCWSIQALRRKKSCAPIALWPVRLIQLLTAGVYLFSLPHKLESDAAWLNGDFMYYVLVNSTWSRFPAPELAYHWPFSAALTYSALGLEAIFPLFVWWPKFRLPLVVAASLFHIAIALFLANVTFFSLSMAAAFIFFLKDRDFDWLHQVYNGKMASIRKRLGRRREVAEAPG